MSTEYKNILPHAKDLMRFRIFDGNGSEIMGQNADLPLCNAVFMGIEEILQSGCDSLKIARLEEMNVNESVWARFRMCSTTGVYKILRVL